MNFELTEDQTRIRDAVREFAAAEIAPGVAERERERARSRGRSSGRLGEMGILGMMVPEEYGGAGADALSYILAVEELARVCASTAVIVSVNNSVACYPIWKFGTRAAEDDDPAGARVGARARRLRPDRAAVGLGRRQPEDPRRAGRRLRTS